MFVKENHAAAVGYARMFFSANLADAEEAGSLNRFSAPDVRAWLEKRKVAGRTAGDCTPQQRELDR
ncbi:MAG: hypothetical protein KGJ84_07625 [Elusimicrobia bacterium]|nr:hypothetical protein [Elusimicrobiota bacterium]